MGYSRRGPFGRIFMPRGCKIGLIDGDDYKPFYCVTARVSKHAVHAVYAVHAVIALITNSSPTEQEKSRVRARALSHIAMHGLCV